MKIRLKTKEYTCGKLRDQYTLAYFNDRGRRSTASTWDVEIFCNLIQDWMPFEKAYGELITSGPDGEIMDKLPE